MISLSHSAGINKMTNVRYDFNKLRFIQHLRMAKIAKLTKLHSSLPSKRMQMFGPMKGSQRNFSFVLIETNLSRLVSLIWEVDDNEQDKTGDTF